MQRFHYGANRLIDSRESLAAIVGEVRSAKENGVKSVRQFRC